jgi:hypothetical protein
MSLPCGRHSYVTRDFLFADALSPRVEDNAIMQGKPPEIAIGKAGHRRVQNIADSLSRFTW